MSNSTSRHPTWDSLPKETKQMLLDELGYFFPAPHPRTTPVNATLEQYAISCAEQLGAFGRFCDARNTLTDTNVQRTERP